MSGSVGLVEGSARLVCFRSARSARFRSAGCGLNRLRQGVSQFEVRLSLQLLEDRQGLSQACPALAAITSCLFHASPATKMRTATMGSQSIGAANCSPRTLRAYRARPRRSTCSAPRSPPPARKTRPHHQPRPQGQLRRRDLGTRSARASSAVFERGTANALGRPCRAWPGCCSTRSGPTPARSKSGCESSSARSARC